MVREDQVHATPVDIEMLSQVFLTHRRTFAMPSGETVAPRRRPAHDMFRLCTFPEGEVDGVMFLVLAVQRTGRVQHILDITARKDTVIMIFVVFLYVKINGAFAFVSISVVKNLLYQFDLLDDMARSMRFDAGRKHVEGLHRLVVTVQVELHYFHRLQLFQTGFLGNFVFTFIGIMFQMTYVGNVAYITYFVSYMCKITEQQVECDSRAGVSQMRIAIDRRTTDIHAYVGFMQRDKLFLLSCERVVNT